MLVSNDGIGRAFVQVAIWTRKTVEACFPSSTIDVPLYRLSIKLR
jgi:hypothetical protein